MPADPVIDRPILILGAPRSGTTLLFSMVTSHPAVWSLYRESEPEIEAALGARAKGRPQGHALSRDDATDEVCRRLRTRFYRRSVNYQALTPNRYTRVFHRPRVHAALQPAMRWLVNPWLKPRAIRLAEKTPRNCLRIGFLDRVFPDALYLGLVRHPYATIGSLLDGWRGSERFATYRPPGGLRLEGYDGSSWKFLMPPGWQDYLRDKSLAEVCAFQYVSANQRLLDELAPVPAERRLTVRYEDLVADPVETGRAICRFASLRYEGALELFCRDLPAVNTESSPQQEKWRGNESEVLCVRQRVEALAARLGYSL